MIKACFKKRWSDFARFLPELANLGSDFRGQSFKWDSTSKCPTLTDHTITAQSFFKQLIVRQRRLQKTFCGRYEQTANSVYFRLAQLTAKGGCAGRERASRKEKQGKQQKEHLSHLVHIVVVCLLGVPKAWRNAGIESE